MPSTGGSKRRSERLHGSQGELDGEGRAFAEAGGGMRFVGTVEAVKDVRQRVFNNAHAVILEGHVDMFVVAVRADTDCAVLRGIAARVL